MAQLGARLDGIEEVVGSNPIGSTKILRVQPGDMGNTFGPKGFSSVLVRASAAQLRLPVITQNYSFWL